MSAAVEVPGTLGRFQRCRKQFSHRPPFVPLAIHIFMVNDSDGSQSFTELESILEGYIRVQLLPNAITLFGGYRITFSENLLLVFLLLCSKWSCLLASKHLRR